MKDGRWSAILFHGRVGSTYLCKLMNTSPEIVNFGELFNPHGIAFTLSGDALQTMLRVAESYGIQKLQDLSGRRRSRVLDTLRHFTRTGSTASGSSRLPWRNGRETVEFLEVFRDLAQEAFPETQWFSFKSAFTQNRSANDDLLANRDIRKILLRRRNVLAVYSSHLVADKTRVYHGTTNKDDAHYGIKHFEKEEVLDVRVRFRRHKFERFRRRYVAAYDEALRALTRSGQSWLEVNYVDLVSGRANAAIEKEFSLSSPLRNDQVELFKTGSSNPLERFENPGHVVSHLEKIGRSSWAEPEFG